jgi:hypothetical protein
MNNKDYSWITPEMARAELAKRKSMQSGAGEQQSEPQQEQQPSSSGSTVSNALGLNPLKDPMMRFAGGVGSSLANTATGLANLIPGVNIPSIPSPEGTAGTLGKYTGDIASYMIGGAGLKAGLKGLEALPNIGKAAELLGKSGVTASGIRRLLGGGLYGAATTEGGYGDKGMGALKGAAISAALEMPNVVTGGVASALKGADKAQDMAEQIVNGLKASVGKSKTPLEDMGKSIAQDVKNAYDKETNIVNGLYEPVLNKFGKQSLYQGGEETLGSKYLSIASKKYPIDDLADTHDEFLKSPTFQNGHNLQKDLGEESRRLERMNEKSTLNTQDYNLLQYIKKTRSALKSDMDNFLRKRDVDSANLYEVASDYFRENVRPFRSIPIIKEIAKGNQTNPKNITTIFRNPNEAEDSDLTAVMGKMGPEFKNKVLFSSIGKDLGQGSSPEKLIKSFLSLDKKGLGSYATPEFQEQISGLATQMAKEGRLKKIGGFIGGAALAHGLGGGIPGAHSLIDLLGGMGGAEAASKGGLQGLGNAFKNLGKGYSWLRNPSASILTRGNE